MTEDPASDRVAFDERYRVTSEEVVSRLRVDLAAHAWVIESDAVVCPL